MGSIYDGDTKTAHCANCGEDYGIEGVHQYAPWRCIVCQRAICWTIYPDGTAITERCAEIRRGDFAYDVDSHGEIESDNAKQTNIKFDRSICAKCFMEDENLCRFFNKLGLLVR